MRLELILSCLLFVCLSTSLISQKEMKLIEGGTFVPLYGVQEDLSATVSDFYLDVTPVTYSEYLEFVKENADWSKSKAPKLFVDDMYLHTWKSDSSFDPKYSDYPITNISWFAAKNYCIAQGKRLPTVSEWEYAAMADAHTKDARKDSLYNVKILNGYEIPNTQRYDVGQDEANYWGIHNLHGMVWEWTSDFNSIMLSGENRSNDDKNLFCGAGAISASDLMNYAAFMRYAMRASVKARYSINTIGFRCAKDTNS